MSQLGGALAELLGALDALGIRYFIGGSVASGNFGLPRQTNDVDVIADVTPETASSVCRTISSTFYADAKDAAAAIRNGRAFNVIHLQSAYKFDIFPVADNAYARARRFGRNQIAPNGIFAI
jgi:hypothetical protein